MGAFLRRVSERFKEKTETLGGNKRGFMITSNKRNAAMMKEAGNFAAQMKQLEKDLRALKLAAEVALKTTKDTMLFPLPRVFRDEAAAVAASQSVGTACMSPGLAEAVSSLAVEGGRQLSEEVFLPMVRWQRNFAVLVARSKDLQNLRLEMDSRKRQVDELSGKIDRLRAKAGAGDTGKAQTQLDSTTLKLQHKQGKLTVTQERFAQQEEDLHHHLSLLIQDAFWIRNYACAALRIEGTLLSHAADAVGTVDSSAIPQPGPLPSPLASTQGSPQRVRPAAPVPAAAAAGAGAEVGVTKPMWHGGSPERSQGESVDDPPTPTPAAPEAGAALSPAAGRPMAWTSHPTAPTSVVFRDATLEGAPSPPRHLVSPFLPAPNPFLDEPGQRKRGPLAAAHEHAMEAA